MNLDLVMRRMADDKACRVMENMPTNAIYAQEQALINRHVSDLMRGGQAQKANDLEGAVLVSQTRCVEAGWKAGFLDAVDMLRDLFTVRPIHAVEYDAEGE